MDVYDQVSITISIRSLTAFCSFAVFSTTAAARMQLSF